MALMKGYKIRIYPSKQQKEMIIKQIGACRFIWNYMLSYNEDHYAKTGKVLTNYDMMAHLKDVVHSEEYSWLQDSAYTSLQRVCTNLWNAYKGFFKNSNGHPTYKTKKHPKQACPVRSDTIRFKNECVKIEKIGKMKYQTDLDLSETEKQTCKNAQITYYDNRFFLTFSLECEKQTRRLTNKCMGIDLGIRETAVVAFGEEQIVFHNINKSKEVRRLEALDRYYSHVLSNKYRINYEKNKNYDKTKNIIKMENKLRKVRLRKRNIRKNYTHQMTNSLIKCFPFRVTMEDLCVIGFRSSRGVAQTMQGQWFYEIYKQMKYKSERNGIEFILADRYFPSSKTCSRCGFIKHDLKLSHKIFRCDNCGLKINRDYNAAINLMKYEA